MNSLATVNEHAPSDGATGKGAAGNAGHGPAPERRTFLRFAAAGAGVAMGSGLLLSACGGGGAAATAGEGRATAQSSGLGCGATTWPLTMGQTTVVGSVTVSNDATNLYVVFAIDTANFPDCSFGTLHAWAGSDIANVPANRQGIPVPGQFPFHRDAGGTTSHTFTVPLASLAVADVAASCGLSLFVVTHAEVLRAPAAGTSMNETAFGGTLAGSGPRWWFYGSYGLCCEFGEPQVETCETAFAKGTHVFTSDDKSNPEGLPTLGLTRNRWGWAIRLDAPSTSRHDLWAGAGQNDTRHGSLAGELTVAWDGSTAIVTYATSGSWAIKEVHLYAEDAEPTTIAPGQYGHLARFDPKVTRHTFTVPLSAANGSGGVWLIAHAVVCSTCCG